MQVLPSEAYNAQGVIDHGRLYAREFAKVGISRDRYCLKIPSTGPALNGAKVLEREGIRTLGTALFNVAQSIACSQAGCLSISPYYSGRLTWLKVDDPATQHPMSPRIVQILETYKKLYKETGKEQPLIKLARYVVKVSNRQTYQADDPSLASPQEAMAAAELGCHSATISHSILEELSKLQYDSSKQPGEGKPKPTHEYVDAGPLPVRLQKLVTIDPLAPADWDGKLASTEVDYLANNGSELQRAIAADPITQQRLNDALDLFKGAEARSRVKIEAAMAEV